MATMESNKNTGTYEKAPKGKAVKASLVELKNGRLNLKQRVLAFEKMSETMQEIVKFRDMLEQRIEDKAPPLDDVPEEFKPLVAKLVHESDKNIVALAKHVHSQLIPAQDEDDEDAIQATKAALPIELLDRAAKSVAERINYGLEASTPGAKIPAGWNIWRWEVKNEYRDWLPKAAKEKIETRLAERTQAKKDVQVLFESLPEQERATILGVKDNQTPKARGAQKRANGVVMFPVEAMVVKLPLKPTTQSTQEDNIIAVDVGDPTSQHNQQSPAQNGPSRPKKPADTEKTAKEKEREEKKNAKLEKEKKEKAAQEKSRSLMANFFTKGSKAKPSTPTRSSSLTKGIEEVAAGPSNVQSDYVRTFKPFVIKRDVELAPINWFRQSGGQQKIRETRDLADGKTVIVIDDDEERARREDVSMMDVQSTSDLGQMTAEELLRNSLAKVAASTRRRVAAPSGLKSHHPHVVRNILNQLTEAEIAGDDSRVRSLLSLLRNRQSIPAKVLIFTEDARPGYFGTWTRNSREVGPRTPFARDVVALDYTYDSGEEWEEESGEADDVVEDAEEEDAAEDPDSDLDSWLVDDDEVEEPGTPVEDRELSPGMPPYNPPMPVVSKRKPNDDSKNSSKRRKVVIPLMPFTKGPCWENHIGKCDYDLLKSYRIQLLNDTPFPINPFTFVANPVCTPAHERKAQTSFVPGPPPTAQFAVPALPERLTKSVNDSPAPQNTHPVPKRTTTVVPKTSFPDAHVPLLVAKIIAMETGNITGIVETVYQELRAYKVKKNAIEAKLREIGEKSKEKKVWVVKPGFMPINVPP